MQSTDKPKFLTMLAALCDYYQRAPLDKGVAALYWDGLAGYDYEEVSRAVKAHMADPTQGSFFPKISDITRHFVSGHPSADEAWAICMRMVGEDDTAVITGEMREAWTTAWPVMEQGDDIGARMAFKAAYSAQISQSQGKPEWELQLGTNAELRARRIQDAVRLGRLPESALAVHALPVPSSGIAGLIAGAKETIRLAAQDGAIVDHATKAITHLQTIREGLNAKHDGDSSVADREAKRHEFEVHRNAELAKLEAKLSGK